MASAKYTAFSVAKLTKLIDMINDTIVAYAVNVTGAGTLYTFNAAHSALSDIPEDARVAVSGALTGKSVTGGVFDSDNPVFPSVTGDTIEAVVLYDSTAGVLIGYWDGVSATPDGNNITVTVPSPGWFTD